MGRFGGLSRACVCRTLRGRTVTVDAAHDDSRQGAEPGAPGAGGRRARLAGQDQAKGQAKRQAHQTWRPPPGTKGASRRAPRPAADGRQQGRERHDRPAQGRRQGPRPDRRACQQAGVRQGAQQADRRAPEAGRRHPAAGQGRQSRQERRGRRRRPEGGQGPAGAGRGRREAGIGPGPSPGEGRRQGRRGSGRQAPTPGPDGQDRRLLRPGQERHHPHRRHENPRSGTAPRPPPRSATRSPPPAAPSSARPTTSSWA
ncbi:MAG: hypothetical protein QOF60_270 [Actinomycetota bacterium]|nr:hypothetical protein [Actinomycetota bacterium]